MGRLLLLSTVTMVSALAAGKVSAPELSELALTNPAGLRDAIAASFDARELKAGTAWTGRGPDFFFALESSATPSLFVDDAAGPAMRQVPSSGLWYAAVKIPEVGRLHAFYYMVDGRRVGGRLDVPAFTALSYQQPGVPSGALSEKMIHTSKMYDGMKSEWWIYVPAQYDPRTAAALMVFQDGGGYLNRNGNNPALNVIDNLIASKKIPVMICVFINPGDIGGAPGTPTFRFVQAFSDKWHRTLKDAMRSTLYDTVSDRYPRFLRDEILSEVGAKYNLRKDAYSRAITGSSSGGICAFNAAWQMPDLFSRVITWIGSYTAIQWKEDPANADGGQDFPEKVLREPKRNLRVWLQDGSEDQENPNYGSWPLANVRMANALKIKNYDFHLSYGKGTHNGGHGASEFPAEMMWAWRDYEAAKTDQGYEMQAEEKDKPLFRIGVMNRETR